MITREADYAIRAVLHLAAKEGTGLVATDALATEMLVPYRFLRRIVQKLVEGGLVEAHRGKGGGLRLARPAVDISVADVLSVIDPKALKLNACLVNGNARCPRASICSVRPELRGVQEQLGEALTGINFRVLAAATPSPASP